MVYFSVMLKITRFPESVVYFDSNAELNIFVFLNSNHFGPGLKHLQLHCFRENVNPNFCLKYLVLSVYVVFKFNSIRRRNKKKLAIWYQIYFGFGIAVVRDLDPGRSFSLHSFTDVGVIMVRICVFPKSGDSSLNISALGSGKYEFY